MTQGRPLRVLHTIDSLAVGGAENLLAAGLPRLAARGVDVRVRALTGPSTLVGPLRSAGIDADVLVDTPGPRRQTLPLAARRLRWELSQAPVDVVHTHLFDASQVARLVALTTRPRPRLVTSLHYPYQLGTIEGVARWKVTARKTLDWSTSMLANEAVIAVSQAVAADFGRAMGRRGAWRRIDVVHNAIDVDAHERALAALDRDAERRRWGFAADELALLSIGRLSFEKNMQSVIDAVALLARRGVRATALVLGDGPQRESLVRVGAGAGVRFHGRASRDEVLSALAACDVYVQTSRFEAFGMAILEAMAAARPVVATNVDGIPEVVADGETGLLVPPDAPDLLADALERFARDPAAGGALGLAGRDRARQHFGIDRWAERTRDLYLRLCDSQW